MFTAIHIYGCLTRASCYCYSLYFLFFFCSIWTFFNFISYTDVVSHLQHILRCRSVVLFFSSFFVVVQREKNDDESLGVVRVWFIPLKISTFNAHCCLSTWSSCKINLKNEWCVCACLLAFFLVAYAISDNVCKCRISIRDSSTFVQCVRCYTHPPPVPLYTYDVHCFLNWCEQCTYSYIYIVSDEMERKGWHA